MEDGVRGSVVFVKILHLYRMGRPSSHRISLGEPSSSGSWHRDEVALMEPVA